MLTVLVKTCTLAAHKLNADRHATSWPLTAHGEAVSALSLRLVARSPTANKRAVTSGRAGGSRGSIRYIASRACCHLQLRTAETKEGGPAWRPRAEGRTTAIVNGHRRTQPT